jgi:tetratricopeptide (TPR) repeat protein
MKKIIVLLVFICSLQAFAQDANRRKELIAVINDELVEIKRLNNQVGAKNPSLLIRLAELYLEKARLIKEDENEKYLSLSPEKRLRSKKENYFKGSRSYFEQAQKTCLFTLKRFNNFEGKGAVYYILAYNAKEFRDLSGAKKYFVQAVKFTKPGTEVHNKSKLALAELYFNDKEAEKAVPLYEQALLSGEKNKWWTKDAYNLAWSYYRTKNYDKAIETLKDVEELSADEKYIDMRKYIEKDMALFLVKGGQTEEAVDYYKGKEGGEIVANLIQVGENLINKGEFTTAEEVLNKALTLERKTNEDIAIRLALLNLYDRFGRVNKHLESAQKLNEYHKSGSLDKEKTDNLKFHAAKMGAILQKQVVDKTYAGDSGKRTAKAKLSVEYFNIMADLEPQKSHVHYLHGAETLYASGLFSDALSVYEKSHTLAKDRKDEKIEKIALDGMMASLAGKGVNKEAQEKYISKVYAEYLENFPTSDKSYKIYQRLFTEQMDAKNVKQAEATLLKFKKHYPEDHKTQEAMVARIMDYHRANKDNEAIKAWVGRINSGEFVVSKTYAAKLKALLINMQFEGVEQASSKGDKLKALKGYASIYKDPRTSQDAKTNSAYNMAVLFHELGDSARTYRWGKQALSLMDSTEVQKFENTFMTFASDFFDRRKFDEAAEFYEIALQKLCEKDAKNKNVMFKNAVVIYLASNKPEDANRVIDYGLRCKITASYVTEARLDVLKSYSELERWSSFEELLSLLEADAKYAPELIYPMWSLYKAFKDSGRFDRAKDIRNKMISLYDKCKKDKLEIPLEGLDVIALFKLASVEAEVNELEKIKLAFPEAVYNERLKQKFAQLDKLTTKSIEVLESGSGKGIVRTYKILIDSYRDLAKEINTFTPPEKSEEYVTSFRKSMQNLSSPISQKANDFFQSAVKEINKSSILSTENSWFLTNPDLPIHAEYHFVRAGILMDRGGKK